ncbi:hypothetical protein [Methylobrevis pamukkalensis]|uniref:Uncharacterized protein n=1 Tax=Methylobrevis pamukkalensis TaxID=1439726 RepID=A0A1E3H043_9HYPH|nr:hypothetical protein [Methylobrevis pamukkalensis]ODN69650.1 hypothetical protein A6302_03028 [Methylobrevis pamukkalensis]
MTRAPLASRDAADRAARRARPGKPPLLRRFVDGIVALATGLLLTAGLLFAVYVVFVPSEDEVAAGASPEDVAAAEARPTCRCPRSGAT